MKDDKILSQVHKDYVYAKSSFEKLFKEIKKDFEFVQGKQWSNDDIQNLRQRGIKALSINKIKPIIKLITGIERQSRSDFKAYPEGGEDSIVASVVSRLLKNAVKMSKSELKLSEQFKHGAIGGPSYLEPYIDYSFDLINGDLKFKRIDARDVLIDPEFNEYDLSDARFVIKITRGLIEDDLIALFPDKESKIKNIEEGRIDFATQDVMSEHIQGLDYPKLGEGDPVNNENPVKTYDLIDYYYKKLVTKYFIADPSRGVLKEAESKEQAESIAMQVQSASVIERKVPAIYLAQVVGTTVLSNDQAWTYPMWKSYPIIPFFFEYITESLGDLTLSIQGIVRSCKDLQEEFNKRRTQELNHLNSSTNSGWLVPKKALDDDNLMKMKEVGSAPGVVIEYDPNKGRPEKLFPTPLSQGHVQLAEENSQDLKEASGVNPDLLANTSQSQSGRAILLKQRQGLVMIQEALDNFSETKKLLGRFILSQLREIFTVESAMNILGDSFIQENFTVPVTAIIERGLQKLQNNEQPTELEQAVMLQYPSNGAQNPVVDERGNLVTAVDFDSAILMINNVLTNQDLAKYDIAIGEGPFAETIRMSNFMELTDLAKQGIPIPPDILIQQSMIPDSEKQGIIKRLQAAEMAQAQMAQSAQPTE